jgi:hypothetical protein
MTGNRPKILPRRDVPTHRLHYRLIVLYTSKFILPNTAGENMRNAAQLEGRVQECSAQDVSMQLGCAGVLDDFLVCCKEVYIIGWRDIRRAAERRRFAQHPFGSPELLADPAEHAELRTQVRMALRARALPVSAPCDNPMGAQMPCAG